jgi:hypothetical protein
MAAWGAEIEWHERDVVVPTFRRWLEAQGWTTEAEKGYIDVVAHRGRETIYAEVKGRTKGRPGAGLDSLYGQLLRRMPAEESGDSNRDSQSSSLQARKRPLFGFRAGCETFSGLTSTW